jgi:hypothetical protein
MLKSYFKMDCHIIQIGTHCAGLIFVYRPAIRTMFTPWKTILKCVFFDSFIFSQQELCLVKASLCLNEIMRILYENLWISPLHFSRDSILSDQYEYFLLDNIIFINFIIYIIQLQTIEFDLGLVDSCRERFQHVHRDCDPRDTSLDSISFAEKIIGIKKVLTTDANDPIINDYYYIINCGIFLKIVDDFFLEQSLFTPEDFFKCKSI